MLQFYRGYELDYLGGHPGCLAALQRWQDYSNVTWLLLVASYFGKKATNV